MQQPDLSVVQKKCISLNWLPVQDLIHIKILALAFKSLAGTAPFYLSSLLSKHSPLKSLSFVRPVSVAGSEKQM